MYIEFNSYEEYEEHYKRQEEFKKRKEERENSMPFLDFLKDKYEEVERLYHRNHSNSSYTDARDIIGRIIGRLNKEGEERHLRRTPLSEMQHLTLTEEILNSFAKTNRIKGKAVIADFKNNLKQDLEGMISDSESPADLINV